MNNLRLKRFNLLSRSHFLSVITLSSSPQNPFVRTLEILSARDVVGKSDDPVRQSFLRNFSE